MKEWVAIVISALTMLVLIGGGFYWAGQAENQLAKIERIDTKLDDARERLARIEGQIGAQLP